MFWPLASERTLAYSARRGSITGFTPLALATQEKKSPADLKAFAVCWI